MSSLRPIPVIACYQLRQLTFVFYVVITWRFVESKNKILSSVPNQILVDLQQSTMKLAFACFLLIFNLKSSCAIFKAPQDADSENDSYKILNGFAKMQFSYTVKIFSRENRKTLQGFSCSGSILHHSWIITAAHCVYSFKVFDVFIGNVTNDVNHVVSVSQVFIHPNFTFDPELLNDLALMKLKRSLNVLNNSKWKPHA